MTTKIVSDRHPAVPNPGESAAAQPRTTQVASSSGSATLSRTNALSRRGAALSRMGENGRLLRNAGRTAQSLRPRVDPGTLAGLRSKSEYELAHPDSVTHDEVKEISDLAQLAWATLSPREDLQNYTGNDSVIDISEDPGMLKRFNMVPEDLKPEGQDIFAARMFVRLPAPGSDQAADFLLREDRRQHAAHPNDAGPDTPMDAVLAFPPSGTNPAEWTDNFKQAIGSKSPAIAHAARVGEKLRDTSHNIQMVGASRGGAHAAIASLTSGKPATTFNSAGVHKATLRRVKSEFSLSDAAMTSPHVRAVRMKGDAVSKAAKLGLIPSALGEDYVISPEDAGYIPARRHAIDAVAQSLNHVSRNDPNGVAMRRPLAEVFNMGDAELRGHVVQLQESRYLPQRRETLAAAKRMVEAGDSKYSQRQLRAARFVISTFSQSLDKK